MANENWMQDLGESRTFGIADRERDILADIGYDKVPHHIVDKNLHQLIDLTGKKALVTGSGGPGLGQATANRLAGLGAEVVVQDRNAEGAQQVADEIARKWDVKTHVVVGDVTDWDSVHSFMKEGVDKLGGTIDILVNNVGAGPVGLFETLGKAEIDANVSLSLVDTLYCSRAVLDYMIPQGHGHIINVASEAARNTHPGLTTYAAAKAGVVHFTRNLAHEVAHHGLHVNGVAPGTMLHESLKTAVLNPNSGAADAIVSSFAKQDIKRVSIPEEVANVIAFLCTEAAGYLSGVTISSGGGIAALG